MKNSEMNKFMAWLIMLFPNWNVDNSTSGAWANELPDLTADQAIQLVRRLQAKKPSPFPPSVFEIIAELKGSTKLDARRMWIKILDRVKRQGRNAYPYDLNDAEKQAIRLIGGVEIIANSQEGDPFLEKRFLEVCENLKEEYAQLSIGAGEMRQIGHGEGLCEVDNDSQQPRRLAKGNDRIG